MLRKTLSPTDGRIRYLARRAVIDGTEYRLVTLEIHAGIIKTEPFDRETHSTAYADTVIVTTAQDGSIILDIKP